MSIDRQQRLATVVLVAAFFAALLPLAVAVAYVPGWRSTPTSELIEQSVEAVGCLDAYEARITRASASADETMLLALGAALDGDRAALEAAADRAEGIALDIEAATERYEDAVDLARSDLDAFVDECSTRLPPE